MPPRNLKFQKHSFLNERPINHALMSIILDSNAWVHFRMQIKADVANQAKSPLNSQKESFQLI